MFSLVGGCMSSCASRAVTKVEWRGIYSIDDGDSWRQGAAGSQRRYLAWSGGRCCSTSCGIDAEGSSKISALIVSEDGTTEECDNGSTACACGAH